jgi:hypothetical protein
VSGGCVTAIYGSASKFAEDTRYEEQGGDDNEETDDDAEADGRQRVDCLLDDNQWAENSIFYCLSEPGLQPTKTLEGDKYPVMGMVLPHMHSIRCFHRQERFQVPFWKNNGADIVEERRDTPKARLPTWGKKFNERMKTEINNRFFHRRFHRYYYVSVVADPRIDVSRIVEPGDAVTAEEMRKMFVHELKDVYEKNAELHQQQPVPVPTPSPTPRAAAPTYNPMALAFCSPDTSASGSSGSGDSSNSVASPAATPWEQEAERFFAYCVQHAREHARDAKFDILKFASKADIKRRFPIYVRLVRRTYGALPHEANCERVFSHSGGVCTFKRDSLNWRKVERLVRVPYNSATRRLEVSAPGRRTSSTWPSRRSSRDRSKHMAYPHARPHPPTGKCARSAPPAQVIRVRWWFGQEGGGANGEYSK